MAADREGGELDLEAIRDRRAQTDHNWPYQLVDYDIPALIAEVTRLRRLLGAHEGGKVTATPVDRPPQADSLVKRDEGADRPSVCRSHPTREELEGLAESWENESMDRVKWDSVQREIFDICIAHLRAAMEGGKNG